MRWLLLGLMMTCGCIEDQLVPCGDLACPRGEVCVTAGRCAAPAQLASCAGLSEEDPCTVASVPGACLGGVCTALICGDGQIEPGEVCDDRNQVSGDGCNGTCTSDETCGNGVLDLAAGEGCDCGVDGAMVASCLHVNSDDPAAECDASCQPRFCGDGEINTIEQCDGSLPANATCAEFGYYRGTPTCTSVCQVSPSSCNGRCGDGAIDADFGEYCDQVMPSDASCVGFGYDLGRTSCGIGCGASLSECQLFGWSTAFTHPPADTWGGNGQLAVVTTAQDGWYRTGTTWTQVAGTGYRVVTGTPTSLWFVGDATIMTNTGGSWTSITVPWSVGTQVKDAWASETLGLYVSDTLTTTLWHYDQGAWTNETGPCTAGRFPQVRTQRWILCGDAYHFDGTTWVPHGSNHVSDMAEDSLGRIWMAVDGALTRDEVAIPGLPPIDTVWPARDAVYASSHNFSAGTQKAYLWFLGAAPLYFDNPPLAGAGEVISDGEWPYVPTLGGVDTVRYGQWRSTPGGNAGIPMYASPGGPLVAVSTYESWVLSEISQMVPLSFPEADCSSATISSTGATLLGCPSGLFENTTLVQPASSVEALWADKDGDAAALVYANGAFGGQSYGLATRTVQGTWATQPTAVHAVQLAGDALDDLFALDSAGALQHFDGTTWTPLATDVTSPLTVTTSRVWWFSQQTLYAYDRTTHAILTPTGPENLHSLVATGGDELFAIGNAQVRGSPLYFYDGTTWTAVRMPGVQFGPGYDALVAIGRSVLYAHAEGPRPYTFYFLDRTGPWW